MLRRNRGFTLVEIVVVVVVLSILSLVCLLGVTKYMKTARCNFDKLTCTQFEDVLTTAFQDKQLPYGTNEPYVYIALLKKLNNNKLWFEKSYTVGSTSCETGDYVLPNTLGWGSSKLVFEEIIHDSGFDLNNLNTDLSKTKNKLAVVARIDEFGFMTDLRVILIHKKLTTYSMNMLKSICKYYYPDVTISGYSTSNLNKVNRYIAYDGNIENWNGKLR